MIAGRDVPIGARPRPHMYNNVRMSLRRHGLRGRMPKERMSDTDPGDRRWRRAHHPDEPAGEKERADAADVCRDDRGRCARRNAERGDPLRHVRRRRRARFAPAAISAISKSAPTAGSNRSPSNFSTRWRATRSRWSRRSAALPSASAPPCCCIAITSSPPRAPRSRRRSLKLGLIPEAASSLLGAAAHGSRARLRDAGHGPSACPPRTPRRRASSIPWSMPPRSTRPRCKPRARSRRCRPAPSRWRAS